jgi:WS/DGAT/MGAT family acyltransferase
MAPVFGSLASCVPAHERVTAESARMRQLSGLDYAFLQLERGNNFMHVAGLGIYDPPPPPAAKCGSRTSCGSSRHASIAFRISAAGSSTVPWMLDRPWWVEDAELDVEFHVRHIALPQPGDWRQLCIQVARLHSRPLDRSKPLWEAYVIEGLHNVPGVPPGSFALYTKLHHALIDGEAGSELTRAIHSLSPDDVETEDGAGVTVHIADREPSAIEIYARAIANNLQKLPELTRFSVDTATRAAGLGAGLVRRIAGDRTRLRDKLAGLVSGDLTAALPRLPPATRFSGPAHRAPRRRGRRYKTACRAQGHTPEGGRRDHQRPLPDDRRWCAQPLPRVTR